MKTDMAFCGSPLPYNSLRHPHLFGDLLPEGRARHAADAGSAVVVVSHDQEWIAPLSDRLVTLREGKLVEKEV